MEWINSNEREPENEGMYFCIDNNIKKVLEFVKIKPKKKHFVINEHYNNSFLKESIFWTENINGASFIHSSNNNLFWLEEK